MSKRTEYGLRALVHLARLDDDRYVQSRDLARAEQLPGKYVELILMSLRRAGLLKSRAGVGGGYRLARSPAHIRVVDVIRSLQRGDDQPSRRSRDFRSPGDYAVKYICGRLDDVVENALGELTLEKLLDQIPRTVGAGTSMYYI
ncbi:MAG: Rrf2 family transcriptional regulator [Phycisphaerae bacterium]|nr:Rrf2 family transcriptional regulator [Phycisphaerae bacterium]MDW8263187.1 Rrf2 family transcriptional regulator [Phycisphaerales bacterium]